MKKSNPNYENALDRWLNSVHDMMEASYNRDLDRGYKWIVTLTVESGRRFDKIVKQADIDRVDGQRFVYAFIEKATGDIYKPATWKAPAKHARGNIFADDGGLTCADPYGIRYLR